MKPDLRPPPVTAQSYFVSFTDLLVGLLFIFIILFVTYAMTYRFAEESLKTRSEKLYQRVQMRSRLLLRVRDNLRPRFEVTVDLQEGVLRFPERILFQSGQDVLGRDGQDALAALAAELRRELPCYSGRYRAASCPGAEAILEAVYIEGHTDDVPISRARSRFPSNWELSSARAIRTYRYFEENAGELTELMNASGRARLLGASAYADSRPARLPKSLPVNRRIDFRFLLAAPPREAR